MSKQLRGTLCGWCLMVFIIAGCDKYGEVNQLTYEFAKALYSVTNQRKTEKLDAVAGQIDQSLAADKLAKKEAAWLHAVIDDAREGKWKKANQACRRMMEEQVK